MLAGTAISQGSFKRVSSVAKSGNRQLVDDDKVFEENAWDNAVWTEEQEAEAASKVRQHLELATLSEETRRHIESSSDLKWDEFYDTHESNFFKDRKWLSIEFPCIKEIAASKLKDVTHDKLDILEIGCGVGNTIFPLIEQVYSAEGVDEDAMGRISFMATDFSPQAIKHLQANSQYHKYQPSLDTAVMDITKPLSDSFSGRQFDIIVCIFVLSAVNPSTWDTVNKNITALLKPGGVVLFRDYGRYDMTQLRFKKHRVLGENFYVRGDGTLVYFFTLEQVQDELFKGLLPLQNSIDRRLLTNRLKKIKMYRVWIQSQFQKPA